MGFEALQHPLQQLQREGEREREKIGHVTGVKDGHGKKKKKPERWKGGKN